MTPRNATVTDPFNASLWGEYARLLLVGTAVCSAIWWGMQISSEMAAVGCVFVVANVLVALIAADNRFAGTLRLTVLLMTAMGLVATLLIQDRTPDWLSQQWVFSPFSTLFAIGVLVLRDGTIVSRRRHQLFTPGKLTLWAMAIGLVVYMIVLPSVDAVWEHYRDRPATHVVKELSPWQELRIRSAKLFVFAIFSYAGACVGSFLNVVAASAPRGESIALRSSACPKCGTLIRRVDNLPIISYLRLRGRCRACAVEIPPRYFYVELVGLLIFASLFLYELITGAANLPGFDYYPFTGILWIILYAKWPVIGVYFFHCALFSTLLMLALMEQQRLRAPRWMVIALPIGFASCAVAYLPLLTVSLCDHTPFLWPSRLPEWLEQAASVVAGGALGWTIGYCSRAVKVRRRQSADSLPLAFALLGLCLGWQAVVTIAVLWLIVSAICTWTRWPLLRQRWLTPTTLLFAVAMLHHPAWKWIDSWLPL